MLNETFNNIPVEQETEDEDTIVYTAGGNRTPLLASIEKEFNLNQIIMNFFFFFQGGESAFRHSAILRQSSVGFTSYQHATH